MDWLGFLNHKFIWSQNIWLVFAKKIFKSEHFVCFCRKMFQVKYFWLEKCFGISKPNILTWKIFWQKQAKYFDFQIFPTKSIKFQAGLKSLAKVPTPARTPPDWPGVFFLKWANLVLKSLALEPRRTVWYYLYLESAFAVSDSSSKVVWGELAKLFVVQMVTTGPIGPHGPHWSIGKLDRGQCYWQKAY